MIKAVIFDFFGVICSDGYWNLVKRDRNAPSDFSRLADGVNLGDISWKEFLTRIAQRTGESPERVSEAYQAEKIDMRVMDLVDQLHKSYKTAIITNAHYDFFEPMVKRTKLDKFFDHIAVSSELGVIKPDQRIFELTLLELGVKPSEAVFIDDIQRYCEAAQRLGMQAIWYQDFPQMKTELETLLRT